MSKIMFLVSSLVIFLGIGLVAAQQDDPPETVTVIVASQPIPRGTILVPALLYGDGAIIEAQQWDVTLAPVTGFRSVNELEGLVVSVDLTTRMPFLAGNLVADLTFAAPIGSDTALLMPEGALGVPIRVEQLQAAPFDLAVLDCVQVEGVLDFGGILSDTRWEIAEQGVVVENVIDVVVVALPPEATAVTVWAQANDLDFVLNAVDCAG